VAILKDNKLFLRGIMKKVILFLLTMICLISNISLAQLPDTIRIKTERAKGYGPFERSALLIQPLSEDNPWNKATPNYKGIPDSLEFLMFAVEQTDFLQFTYQSYYNNKINDEVFKSCKSSWNWNPSPYEYTKDPIKVNIGVVAGYDNQGVLRIKADKNNDYDFSNDEYFTLPEKLPGQNLWGRYSDKLPIEVSYEFYDGNSIKTAKTWIYIDYFVTMYNSTQDKPNPIVLTIGFAEHQLGEFIVNGSKYKIAVKSDRATYRMNSKIKFWRENDDSELNPLKAEIAINGFLQIENQYYRFSFVTSDGSEIILIKDRNVLERGGNQVGFKAINFVSKTLSGKTIELDKLKGKYIYLDFWGTWCSPCREEIPLLKSIYNEYKNKNFVLIGIVNDNIEALKDFVKKQEINWEQILQSEDKSIIADYGVTGYPTTFLIDPNGKIISKNIRAVELSKKLEEILRKK
jgi:peroxiredoxin